MTVSYFSITFLLQVFFIPIFELSYSVYFSVFLLYFLHSFIRFKIIHFSLTALLFLLYFISIKMHVYYWIMIAANVHSWIGFHKFNEFLFLPYLLETWTWKKVLETINSCSTQKLTSLSPLNWRGKNRHQPTHMILCIRKKRRYIIFYLSFCPRLYFTIYICL